MSTEVWLKVISAGCSIIGMVFIWRLVETAMRAGIDGVMFFAGVAAIAGLGGYELHWLVDVIRAKTISKPPE